MGNVVLKYAPDTYLVWNETVEAPELWRATFDETVDYLVSVDRLRPEYARPEAIQRLERARDTGTSQMWHPHQGDDEVFIYQQRGWLYLKEMEAFLDTYNAETHEFDVSLLHPFEDD